MTYHSPGRPPGDWDQEAWRKHHSENFEQHVLNCVISYLKTYKSKGCGVSLSDLSRAIHHRPDIVKSIIDRHHGKWMNGVLGKSEVKGGYYIVWSRVGEDPIPCLHEAWAEIYEVVVKEDQAFAICDRCGSRYILLDGKVTIDWRLNNVPAPNTLNETWGESFTISGKVLDFATGLEAPNFEVKVMVSQWPYIMWRILASGSTDDYGNFFIDLTQVLNELQPGAYVLSVDVYYGSEKFTKASDNWLHLNLAERPAQGKIISQQFPKSARAETRITGNFVIKNIGGTDTFRGMTAGRPTDRFIMVKGEEKELEVTITMPTKSDAIFALSVQRLSGVDEWLTDDTVSVTILNKALSNKMLAGFGAIGVGFVATISYAFSKLRGV